MSAEDVLREPDRAELVAVNRTELRVWRWGDATAPPVLMLHGALIAAPISVILRSSRPTVIL